MKRSLFTSVISIMIFTGLQNVAVSAGTGKDKTAESKVLLMNAEKLIKIKQSLNNKEYAQALGKLKRDAEKALMVEPVSVMSKKQLPPGGNRHDYMSLGKYWFPDPNKADGKPYIRRDGEVNLETKDFPDHDNLERVISSVQTLALSFYYFNNEAYAEHAAKLLRVWFLDTATCMNPNLDFAQAVPGRNDGRGSGIIDAHRIPFLLDALSLLNGSKAWTQKDQQDINKWFGEYLNWLLTSKNGKDEAKAKNNHGSWYDVQVASVAMFIGKKDLAEKTLNESVKDRIARQFEPDGKQPKELERTKALSYSVFNLEAMVSLSMLAENLGVDLWNYETSDGKSILKTLNWVMPFINGEMKWEYKQIEDFKEESLYPLVKLALNKYPSNEQLKEYMDKYAKEKENDRANIIY